MKFSTRSLCVVVFGVAVALSAWAAPPCDGVFFLVYCQPFDGTGIAYSSQNDANGLGLFAQVYDNFTTNGTNVRSVQWVGEYFNPPQQGPITGWTVSLYADAGGQPGPLLVSNHLAGNGNETFLGNFSGFPTYQYGVGDLFWPVNNGQQYWLDVYPDLGFPPQWGWSSGTGGDGISYQDFFGTRNQLAADMALALGDGICCGVPEPGTLLTVCTGAVGAGAYYADLFGVSTFAIWRARRRKHF